MCAVPNINPLIIINMVSFGMDFLSNPLNINSSKIGANIIAIVAVSANGSSFSCAWLVDICLAINAIGILITI